MVSRTVLWGRTLRNKLGIDCSFQSAFKAESLNRVHVWARETRPCKVAYLHMREMVYLSSLCSAEGIMDEGRNATRRRRVQGAEESLSRTRSRVVTRSTNRCTRTDHPPSECHHHRGCYSPPSPNHAYSLANPRAALHDLQAYRFTLESQPCSDMSLPP